MKRLIVLILLAVAAWYAWHHWGDVFHRSPSHEAVVENAGDREMTRVRLTVGDQTFVKESLPAGARAAFPFRVDRDATFLLVWDVAGTTAEHTWSGGMVPKGPLLQRHVLTVDADGAVLYRAENK